MPFTGIQRPWIVPIPGTTELAHLRENMLSVDLEFTPEEWKHFTESVSKIRVVGERYTGALASQVKN